MLKGAEKAPFSLFFSIGIGFELYAQKKQNHEQNNFLQPTRNDGKDFPKHKSSCAKQKLLCR